MIIFPGRNYRAGLGHNPGAGCLEHCRTAAGEMQRGQRMDCLQALAILFKLPKANTGLNIFIQGEFDPTCIGGADTRTRRVTGTIFRTVFN
jgi:hypothetical protein